MTAKRILIVEDEKAIRDMVAFGLRRAGFEVREADKALEPHLKERLVQTVRGAGYRFSTRDA